MFLSFLYEDLETFQQTFYIAKYGKDYHASILVMEFSYANNRKEITMMVYPKL